MSERLLMSPPDVGELEEEYVLRALRSGWVAPTGPEVTAFEEEIAVRAGTAHAVAMSSGTAALHLGMLSLGVSQGDVVIVATMTFVASANAVAYTGAQPCFVDVTEDGNLDPELLERAIIDQRQRGHRVAAVMSVDLLGRCADYESIVDVCARLEAPLIEDAAEALGASYQGAPAGSFGEAAALSFNGNKIMTTSGGGMLVTNDSGIAEHARFLSTQAREPVAHYEHRHIGYNYRMSNILAALGRAQLDRLDTMIERRREIRSAYSEVVEDVPGVKLFQADSDANDNCWLTAIVVDPSASPLEAAAILGHMERDNIEARPLWKPMHLQPVFARADSYLNGNAERLFKRGVTLPSGSVHSEQAIERVCSSLGTALGSNL